MKRSHAASSRTKSLTRHSRLSRSHENLAACGHRRSPGSCRLSVPKMSHTGGPPLRKAHSTQSIDSLESSQSSHGDDRKRVTKATKRQMRISVPPNIMAYNAELLASFEKEKKALEGKISELIQVAEGRKTDLERYRFEVKHLKELGVIAKQQIEKLDAENTLLRKRLTELGGAEHFTDAEKLSLLQNTEELVSPETAVSEDSGRVDHDVLASLTDVCVTPDHPSTVSLDNSNWDRLSTKSDTALSDLCVANLQDRLLQMEETHYSTSEELEATLQELADLQTSLNQLSSENELLADEKTILLESLCAQTEKLENCRLQIEHMKAILVGDGCSADRSEKERLLVRLVRGAAEEKEELLLRQAGIINTMHALEAQNCQLQDAAVQVAAKNDALQGERTTLNGQLNELRREHSQSKTLPSEGAVEVSTVKPDPATINGIGIEQMETTDVKSDESQVKIETEPPLEQIDSENTQQETLAVEKSPDETVSQLDHLREQLAQYQTEFALQKTAADATISQLQTSQQSLEREKQELILESENLRDHIDQLQVDCDRFLEEKKLQASTISDLEKDLTENSHKVLELENTVAEVELKYSNEQQEWKQFQADLQTAVVIANEIKTETEEDLEKVSLENKSLKDKYLSVEEKLHKLEHDEGSTEVTGRRRAFATHSISLDHNNGSELAGRRRVLANHSLSLLTRKADQPQSLTVKNLIATIEAQVKTDLSQSPVSPGGSSVKSDQPASLDVSISSSSSSIPMDPVPAETPVKLLEKRNIKGRLLYDQSHMTDDTKATSVVSEDKKSPKQRQSILSNKSALRLSGDSSEQKTDKYGLSTLQVVKTDPLANLAKQMGGSKRNALLKWCQARTTAYSGIDITNFSSSWNDGLALCALLHTYLPNAIPYKELSSHDRVRNFRLAFKAAQSVGIQTSLNTNDMMCTERPDWQAVMSYLTSIYKHFEVDQLPAT